MNRHILKNIKKKYCSNLNELRTAIEKAEVVSFDIYDTAIIRYVSYNEHLYEIIEKESERQGNSRIDSFVEKRIAAQKKAYAMSNGKEITLREIYDCMDIDSAQKCKMYRVETKVERKISYRNNEIYELYTYALQLGKKVIFTSDMYLSENIVLEILNRNGYVHFSKMYLSSTVAKRKKSGELFEYVIKDMNVVANKIVHIGDSYISDFIMARQKGINAYIYNKKNNSLYVKSNKYISSSLSNDLCHGMVKKVLANSPDVELPEHIGIEVLGLLLWGFVLWMKKMIQSKEYSKIFFLSREGKIIQRAYEVYYGNQSLGQYLYVSRKSVLVPLLSQVNNYQDIIKILAPFLRTPTIENVCKLLEIEDVIFNNQEKNIQFSSDINKEENQEILFKYIKRHGQIKFEEQQQNLKKYLDNIGFKGNIAVCDIGWYGTMQSALKLHVEEETNIDGLYLGVRTRECKHMLHMNLVKRGFLFEEGKNVKYDYMTRFTNEILELLFLNNDGSVLKYIYNNDKNIIPILSESEYNARESDFIDRVQESAIHFIENCKEIDWLLEAIDLEPENVMEGYINMAVNPKMYIVKFFSEFNTMDEKIKKITPNHTLFYYILHPRKFRKDVEDHCKVFTLKKIFRLPLPYASLLRILVSCFGMQSKYRKKFMS